MDVATDEITRWLAGHARPLPLDGPPALPPALSRAAVVGIGAAVRSARELVLATHALLRALVADGFRAVAIEGPTSRTAPRPRWTAGSAPARATRSPCCAAARASCTTVRDPQFRIEAGPVTEAVDVLVHVPVGSAVTPLPPPGS